jgi:hypothetical protein
MQQRGDAVARYVLLEFDDNDGAEGFVAAAAQRGGIFFGAAGTEPMTYGYADHTKMRVRAVFAKPTSFCDCPNPGDRSAKGKKLGWWVHAGCGKPKRGQWQHPNNLLDPPDGLAATRQVYLGIVEPALPPGTVLGPYSERHR